MARVPRIRRQRGPMSFFSTLFTFPLTGFGSAFRRHRRPVSKSVCEADTEATGRATRGGVFESQLARSLSAEASPGGRETPAYIDVMDGTHELKSIPDDELLRRLAELLRQSRRVEADLVALIGEVDSRRLYARSAWPSMFAYCTEVLHLSEAEAYLRIAVARASREHPILLAMLADGRLHLTAIAKLAPHLTRRTETRCWHGPPTSPSARSRSWSRSWRPGRMLRSDDPKAARSPGTGLTCAESPNWSGRSRDARTRTASGRSCSISRLWPGAARRRGAPRAGSLQGPVHRVRPASRQARATPGPHALLGARRRSGRDHRAGRHRDAGTARIPALRANSNPQEGSLGERHLPQDAADPGRRQASRTRARRRPVPLRGRAGQTMRRARRARVPPPAPLRPRR